MYVRTPLNLYIFLFSSCSFLASFLSKSKSFFLFHLFVNIKSCLKLNKLKKMKIYVSLAHMAWHDAIFYRILWIEFVYFALCMCVFFFSGMNYLYKSVMISISDISFSSHINFSIFVVFFSLPSSTFSFSDKQR